MGLECWFLAGFMGLALPFIMKLTGFDYCLLAGAIIFSFYYVHGKGKEQGYWDGRLAAFKDLAEQLKKGGWVRKEETP